MSLIGKIRHFFDPGYYEEEKAPREETDSRPLPPEKDSLGRTIVNAPQLIGYGDNPEPGSVDANCEETPYVILKDVAYSMESDLLAEKLDAEEISYQICEHNPSQASYGYGDTFYERYYVPEEYLSRAMELASSAEEEAEAAKELPDNLSDVDEDTVLIEQEDGSFVDMDTLADSFDAESSADPQDDDGVSEVRYQDGEYTYLLGTDFVLIRSYTKAEDMNKLVRCYRQEGVPYTVTTAADEPESEPFPGYRIYATFDCKNKARRLAEETESDEGDGAVL